MKPCSSKKCSPHPVSLLLLVDGSPIHSILAQVSKSDRQKSASLKCLTALLSYRGLGPNPLKVAILLEKLKVSYDVIALDFGDDAETGFKGKRYLAVTPNGRVPAIVDHTANDFTVWESGAILCYLVDKYSKGEEYLGKTVEERAITMQWLTHQLSGVGPTQGNLNFARSYWELSYGEIPSKGVLTRFEGEIHRLYKLLNDQLAGQAEKNSQWIALDRPTLADFAFYPWVNLAVHGEYSFEVSSYKHLVRWHKTMSTDKDVQAADVMLPKA